MASVPLIREWEASYSQKRVNSYKVNKANKNVTKLTLIWISSGLSSSEMINDIDKAPSGFMVRELDMPLA